MSEQAAEPSTTVSEPESSLPATPPSTRIDGPLRVTISIDELHAIKNPELLGKGDWHLRLWVNGIERWRTEKPVHAGKDETVPVGAAVVTEVPDFTEMIELEVEAKEVDPLNPDEHVSGLATLKRELGFHSGGSFIVDLKDGDKAHIQLRCSVESEPM